MSRNTPLSCQSKKVCIVIRKGVKIPSSLLKEYCSKYFERYAFIEHEHDKEPNTFDDIPVHYHIVGDFLDSRVRFSTRLNDIVSYFHFDNAHGIEIETYRFFESSLQYLTHKNDILKTQHIPSEIITNLSKEEFDIFYNATTSQVVTIDNIVSACLNSNNIVEVIRYIGLSNYRVYRNTIWDVWQEVLSRRKKLIPKSVSDDELPF